MTAKIVDISLCPTTLQFPCGDTYDSTLLLESMRDYISKLHPNSKIDLQIGYQQEDQWAFLDGDKNLGNDLIERFFNDHGTDKELFINEES